MSNPNDDPDVISGLCDDAKKEMTTIPGTSDTHWQSHPRSALHYISSLCLLDLSCIAYSHIA